ncbi:MAG: phosphatidylserine decarboxylase [Proteobacteria bacterium]|nr:phosphatidylserine decarboxylase [Pseudomonadota bacterium]
MNIVLILLAVIAALAAFAIAFNRHFLRDPERTAPKGNFIIAPADGKVIDVVEITPGKMLDIDKGLFGRIKTITADLGSEPCTLVSIFMSPMDVHVQRMPIDGRIVGIQHKSGKFRVTNSLRAIDNERIETLIDSSIGTVKVIQIAGFLVRRIETYLSTQMNALRGQRMGIIKFGSQVSILFPRRDDIRIKVQKGQRVTAGETILAEYAEQQ